MKGKDWGRALVAAGALACAAGCGGTVKETGSARDDGDGAGGREHPGGSTSAGGGGGASGAGGLPVGAGGSGEVCRTGFGPEPLPLDLFVMFDQSSSMSELVPGTQETWWSAATAALTAFVDNPRAQGIGMGIQYFPLDGVAPASCTAPYSTPEVPVGLLPGVATAMKASLGAREPTGLRSSGPALQGAIDYMRSYAQPGRAAAVMLVTGGSPTECEPGDVVGLAEIARAGMAGTPPVRTFVVALGQGPGNLGQVADAGGTVDAFAIDGANVTEQLVNALFSTASTTLRCEFDLPPPPIGEQLDVDLVSLRYTPAATGVGEEIPKLQDRGACDLPENGGHGWYYDDPVNPTRMLACPGTCKRFAAGSVSISYGCSAGGEPID